LVESHHNSSFLSRLGVVAVVCALTSAIVGEAVAQQGRPTPPVPLHKVDAIYPADELAARREAKLTLSVSIGADGTVSEASVVESAGKAFDEAAIVAVKQWRFVPAKRGDEAIPSTIQVPFAFALPPEPPPPPNPRRKPKPAIAPRPVQPRPADKPLEVLAHTKRPPPARAASDFIAGRDVLNAAPNRDAGEMLAKAGPGIYASRPEGEAVAHEIFLRGFDAEHGQDIELTVGPLPVNQPSHIHGQGYADLNFIIPEVVRSMRVTEGAYDPRQGDFAVAGSIDFDLGVSERGVQLRSSYGSFHTFRQLVLWAPERQAEETFAAAVFRRSDGYGKNRGSIAGGAIGQYAFDGPGGFHGIAHLSAHGARANLAGVLRKDDVAAGRVGFYDSYEDPSANAQSAFALRAQSYVSLERPSPNGARTGFAVWLALMSFRLRENFTGYLERSRLEPKWVGRGDLIELENRDIGFGGRAFYRTKKLAPRDWLSGQFEVGLTFRTDFIDQAQNLLQQPLNETWDRRVDASIRAGDIGAYGDLDWRFTKFLRVRGGVRADVLMYDVDDRLGNVVAKTSVASRLPGYRRTAMGAVVGPRASLEVSPLPWLQLIGSYGEGYRSPQARQLDEGENAPFTRVRAVEGGVVLHPWGKERFQLTTAGYATFLSNDLAFDPGEGSLERIGPTSRKGFVVHATARPAAWFVTSASVTYVRATLDEPPAATAQDPTPAFAAGEPLPYVPPVVVRVDMGANKELTQLGGKPLVGRAGAGMSFLSARPLPYGQFADPVLLLDASASLRWHFVELGFEGFNLLDRKYAQNELSFVSDWGSQPIPSRLPARHLAAGPPITVMGTVGLYF
jgi:TonB family protein